MDRNYTVLTEILNTLSPNDISVNCPATTVDSNIDALEEKLPINSLNTLNEVEKMLKEKETFNCLVKYKHSFNKS